MNHNKTLVRGFTLIELLVVISIIGLLASVVLASLATARNKAQNANKISLVRQYVNAAEMYNMDHNSYPFSYLNIGGYNPPSCLGYPSSDTCGMLLNYWGINNDTGDYINSEFLTYIPGPPADRVPIFDESGNDWAGMVYRCPDADMSDADPNNWTCGSRIEIVYSLIGNVDCPSSDTLYSQDSRVTVCIHQQ